MSPDDNTNPLNNNPMPNSAGSPNPVNTPMSEDTTPSVEPSSPIEQGTVLNQMTSPNPETPTSPTVPVDMPTSSMNEPISPVAQNPVQPTMPVNPQTISEQPANMQSQQPITTPKKNSKTLTIVLIVIAAILVGVGAVVLIMMMNNNAENVAVEEQSELVEEPTPVLTTLNCAATITDPETLAGMNNATQYVANLDANYEDNQLAFIEYNEEYTFATAEEASNFSADSKVKYESFLAENGITEDPFESSFVAEDVLSTISHSAEATSLSDVNMAIFNLQVGEDGNVDTKSDSIKKIYESIPGASYVCEVTEE